MKKITLSAAIVALAMMGCSDAGLDNSVASTSEINSEQIQSSANEPLVLAKLGARPNYRDRQAIDNLQPTGGNWNYNYNGYERYQYPNLAIDVEMQTRIDLDNDGYEGQGVFNALVTPFKPNIIIGAVAIVSECTFELNPKDASYDKMYCPAGSWFRQGADIVDNYDEKHSSDQARVNNLTVHTNGTKLGFYKDASHIGVVSAFVCIWGSGSEIVLGWSTYAGDIFKNANGPRMARAVYKKYVLPKLNAKLNTLEIY